MSCLFINKSLARISRFGFANDYLAKCQFEGYTESCGFLGYLIQHDV